MAVWVVGAGGLGRETLDTAQALGLEVAGFLDERSAGTVVRGLPVVPLGEVSAGSLFVVGIADPAVRRRLTERLVGHGLEPVTLVHPRATVAPGSVLGPGSLVLGHAYVSSGVSAGAGVQVHYNATVGHDCALGDRVAVFPGANVAGSVTAGADVTVGSGAVVLQGLSLGEGAFVGAGAVVTRDVAAGVTVVGSPARPLR